MRWIADGQQPISASRRDDTRQSYPSQAKTWLGLFPFVALAMLLRGRQSMQAVQVERVRQRPHTGKLYYEKRGFLAYETLAQAIATHSNSGTGQEA
jgi:hypothetical protein